MENVESPTLILASGSRFRQEMLRRAGVRFAVHPADVDEAALQALWIEKRGSEAENPGALAAHLAEAKAQTVGLLHPGTLILGADQILRCGDKIYNKAEDLAEARRVLQSLRDRPHRLYSAAVLVSDGVRIWEHVDHATLTMRAFTDAFLNDYLARNAADACESVGAYKIEEQGLQLFERIEGDYFTVLGLPLLPVLGALRNAGVLTS